MAEHRAAATRADALANRERILAVYRQEVQLLVAAVPAILAQYPPLEALRAWFPAAG